MPSDREGQAVKRAYLRLPDTPARYRFHTCWVLAAPRESVWTAILDSSRWPEWWPGMLAVTPLQAGDGDGIGDVRHYVWRSRLPYTLEFDVRVVYLEAGQRIEGLATGTVSGFGVWQFADADEGTRVDYLWDVRTVPVWMQFVGPFAKPLIHWNHDVIMRAGGEGLARHLQTRLLSNENETLS